MCHCTDCQTLTGTAFRTNVGSLPGSFVLKSGSPKIYIKTAESGNKRAHAFCPDCGTPLYSVAPVANPPSYGLRVGTLDRRAELRPARQGWCRSALPWSMDLTGVERFERQPYLAAHSIGRPAWVLRESSEVKELASAGIATSAISSGVQPPLWCTMRTGRIWP